MCSAERLKQMEAGCGQKQMSCREKHAGECFVAVHGSRKRTETCPECVRWCLQGHKRVAEEIITVCILPSGHMLCTAGRARVSGECVCESVHRERPTYVPSVPLPPQMAIGVYCVGASVHADTHTLFPGWIGVRRTCVKCELIFCTKPSINLLRRPCGNSVCAWGAPTNT